MAVTAATELARRTVLVYNSNASHAQSKQVADYYCAERGIPVANQFGWDMGSALEWTFDANRYATFWTDLYDHCIAIGARAVFAVSGCPLTISVRDFNYPEPGYTVVSLEFGRLVGYVKRIVEFGAEPTSNSGVGWSYPGPTTVYDGFTLHQMYSNYERTSARYADPLGAVEDLTGVLEDVELPVLRAEATANGLSESFPAQRAKYKASWEQRFENLNTLLGGWVGWYPYGAAYPGDYLTPSKAMITNGINRERAIADLGSRTIFVAIGSSDGSGTDRCHVARWAYLVKVMQDAGLNVTYCYFNGASDATADTFAPVASGIQKTTGTGNWTGANLTAGSDGGSPLNPASVAFDFATGTAFANLEETNWDAYITPNPGAYFTGGLSYNAYWLRNWQALNNGIRGSAVYFDGIGTHPGAIDVGHAIDIMHLLVEDKLTVAEATFITRDVGFIAIGDPLARPFQ